MSTIVAPLEHSPLEDAEVIYQACKGWGTDEKAIISILGHRTAYQRQQIRRAYQELHQEDLVKRLESELRGDFERAVYRWILEPADRDAVLAHVALKKLHPAVIIEIACVLCPEELLAVRRAYQARYQHSLEEDVAAHTTGDMRKLLVGLVSAYRHAGPEINERLAKTEAEILHEAIKHHDYEETIRILTTRSKAQLIATFNRYRDEHSNSITKNLSDSKHQEYSAALRTIIRCFIDPTKYYEKVIRNALKGIGSDEGALTRVIVTRAEKDLRQIKEAYHNRNSVSLEHAVAKETSGDYKHFLVTLIGQEG